MAMDKYAGGSISISDLIFISLLLFLPCSVLNSQTLVVYPAPEGAELSGTYSLTVNERPVPVYDARIDDPDNCGFAYFDFEGTVHVSITVPGGFNTVKIRPQSAGIDAIVQGNKIEFDLPSPRKLCIELDGKISYPLFIFPNSPEIDPPRPDDPNVRYFGPGIHDAGEMVLKTGETVYVAGGAIVKGYFTASNANNIKILGRGIMDAHDNNTSMIRMRDCKNVVVDGIWIVDQPAWKWTTSYYICDSTLVNNVKIIAGEDVSNDGIGIISCQVFTVNDCFIKCVDDCVVIKAKRTNRRSVKDVTITNCLIWNIQAFGIQIGPELDAPEVTGVLVKNCDLIHPLHTETDPNHLSYYYCGALGIMNGDDCEVHNVRYEDIRIEDATAKLISLKIMKTQWNTVEKYGQIHDIYFKDIRVVDGDFVPSEIISFAVDKFYNGNKVKPEQLIRNVTFENLNILGKSISNTQEGGFIVCPASQNLRFIVHD
jgi:hypothetical protein